MAQGVPTPYPDLAEYRSGESGRPTLCTPEIIQAVADHVRIGGYPTVALEALDISGKSHSVWLGLAVRDANAGLIDTSVFCDYSKAVKIAQAEWTSLKLKQLESVHRRVADDRPELWASVTTSLERRLPDLYGKRERQEAPTHATQVNITFAPFPGVQAPSISAAQSPDRAELAGPDTEHVGQTPPRSYTPKDTGGE